MPKNTVETAIVGLVVQRLLDAGYYLSVDNGGDEFEIKPTRNHLDVMNALFATGEEYLYAYKDAPAEQETYKIGDQEHEGWVWLIYGNAPWEVIADYTINLEGALAKATERILWEQERA